MNGYKHANEINYNLILQKGMCKQQLHHHLQMYALVFLHCFLTSLPCIT